MSSNAPPGFSLFLGRGSSTWKCPRQRRPQGKTRGYIAFCGDISFLPTNNGQPLKHFTNSPLNQEKRPLKNHHLQIGDELSVLSNWSTAEVPKLKLLHWTISWYSICQKISQLLNSWLVDPSKWCFILIGPSLNDLRPNDQPVQIIYQSKWPQSKWQQWTLEITTTPTHF